MKRILNFIGAVLITQCSYGQRIELSAVERFFEITDSLRENIAVPDESWQSFLELPGMKLYIAERNAVQEMDGYRKSMEYVYMPQNDSLLEEFLKEPAQYNTIFQVYQYKENEDAFRQYIKQIRKMPDVYLDSTYEYAYSMLPYKMQLTLMRSAIYFVPLFTEVMSYDFDMIISLRSGYFLDNIKYGATGGHLLHHLLRKNRKLQSPKDQYLYQALTAITDEGMADLIDKQLPDTVECPADLKFGQLFLKDADTALVMLDSAIHQHMDGTQLVDSSNMCSLVPMGGHVPGYKMALVIERNGLIEEMLKTADDPLKFVLLYNKAALLDEQKPYVFSDKTVAYLKLLMKKSKR